MADVSEVVVDRVCRCPFSVAHEYAEDFLSETASAGAVIRVPLRDFIPSLRRGGLRQPVRMRFNRSADDADMGRSHDSLEVHWVAQTRLFPDFHGTLRFRIESVDETRLTLEGTYHPPLATFGRIFDAVIGRRIARASLRDLLDELCGAMARREEEFRRKTTPAP